MGKTSSSRKGGKRAASATPSVKPKMVWKNVIDLTDDSSGPGPSSAPTKRPSALSPDFDGGGKQTIAIPQDPNSSPAYIFQQLALHRARSHPSFSSRLQETHFVSSGDETDQTEQGGDDQDDDPREETPTPNSRSVKGKRDRKTPKTPKDKKETKKKDVGDTGGKDKSARKEKKKKSEDARDKHNQEIPVSEPKASEKVKDKHNHAETAPKKDSEKGREKSVVVEGENSTKTPNTTKTKKSKKKTPIDRVRDTEKTKRMQIKQEGHEAATESRKRKRDSDDDDGRQQGEKAQRDGAVSVDGEARAIQRLQESVPAVRKRHVAHRLRQETGKNPSDLAILITAARETIIDLARQQLMQTEQSYHTLQTELLRLLKEQTARLERLEGKQRAEADDEETEDEEEYNALQQQATFNPLWGRNNRQGTPYEPRHGRHGSTQPSRGCQTQVQ